MAALRHLQYLSITCASRGKNITSISINELTTSTNTVCVKLSKISSGTAAEENNFRDQSQYEK